MIKDRVGKRYGMLTVQRFAYSVNRYAYWVCKCDCGNIKIISSKYLITSPFPNCGCSVHKGSIPKQYRKRIYNVYKNIKSRCYDDKNIAYMNYGGRGIKMCPNWYKSYDAFYNWAISSGYKPGLSIDRTDNNGDYCPENCRWATRKEQNRNTRRNKFITFQGKKLCINDWAATLGINRKKIAKGLRQGLTPQQILGLENGKQNKKNNHY